MSVAEVKALCASSKLDRLLRKMPVCLRPMAVQTAGGGRAAVYPPKRSTKDAPPA
jgi:hypothetical protein